MLARAGVGLGYRTLTFADRTERRWTLPSELFLGLGAADWVVVGATSAFDIEPCLGPTVELRAGALHGSLTPAVEPGNRGRLAFLASVGSEWRVGTMSIAGGRENGVLLGFAVGAISGGPPSTVPLADPTLPPPPSTGREVAVFGMLTIGGMR